MTTTRKPYVRKRGICWGTSQVAELLGVSPKTVGRWIDSGKLPGFRLPGSPGYLYRRVNRSVLRGFLIKHGYTQALEELDRMEGPK